jgi:hypothetical protein
MFMCASFLSAQTLVETAKKEKERRAALKAQGKESVVVTNADLRKHNRSQGVATQANNSSSLGSSQPRQQTASRPRQGTTSPSSNLSASRQNSPREIQRRDIMGGRQHATKVLFNTELTKNPEFALNKPDGQFAEISILGVLDLEISAKNGQGDDIAIYARFSGAPEMTRGGVEDEGLSLDSLTFDYREGFWYGVLGMSASGDWEAIGQGTGKNSPERFDLGSLKSITKIRIMFKPHTNADLTAKFQRMQPGESTFGIDAVEALH